MRIASRFGGPTALAAGAVQSKIGRAVAVGAAQPKIRRALVAGAVGVGCAYLSLSATPSLAEAASDQETAPLPPPEPLPLQWLWTMDGVTLRRDVDGNVIYVDDETGETLTERPANVPKEAYANRVRFPPHPTWGTEKAARRGAVRHVLLVRHSQYHLNGTTDGERTLTELGVQQADVVARRLAAIHACAEGGYSKFSLDTILSSGLTRAIQTADLIAPHLPHAQRARNDATLNEGRPCLPEPAPRHASHYTNKGGDGQRIEAAYRLICARPPQPIPPARPADTYEVIVCHANVIRYVVCRALVSSTRRRQPRRDFHASSATTKKHTSLTLSRRPDRLLHAHNRMCVCVCVCVCVRCARSNCRPRRGCASACRTPRSRTS